MAKSNSHHFNSHPAKFLSAISLYAFLFHFYLNIFSLHLITAFSTFSTALFAHTLMLTSDTHSFLVQNIHPPSLSAYVEYFSCSIFGFTATTARRALSSNTFSLLHLYTFVVTGLIISKNFNKNLPNVGGGGWWKINVGVSESGAIKKCCK